MTYSRSRPGNLHMPRSRGAISGLLLLLLGAWGALIPFVGPYFDFAYSPGQAWVWSTARAWLEVLPGVITAAGGFLLFISGNRATAMFGGWLAVIAGGWFVVGRTLASSLRLGNVGQPLAATDAKRAAIEIASFSGLGALIIFLGAAALARMSVRTARDLEYARQLEAPPAVETSGGVAAPAVSPDARTDLAPESYQQEVREKRGLFRRRRGNAITH
jgi:hypothetical protein